MTRIGYEAALKTFEVKVPGKGCQRVKAYSPAWAARQAQNGMKLAKADCYWTCWVREIRYGRRLRAERVKPYSGLGR